MNIPELHPTWFRFLQVSPPAAAGWWHFKITNKIMKLFSPQPHWAQPCTVQTAWRVRSSSHLLELRSPNACCRGVVSSASALHLCTEEQQQQQQTQEPYTPAAVTTLLSRQTDLLVGIRTEVWNHSLFFFGPAANFSLSKETICVAREEKVPAGEQSVILVSNLGHFITAPTLSCVFLPPCTCFIASLLYTRTTYCCCQIFTSVSPPALNCRF